MQCIETIRNKMGEGVLEVRYSTFVIQVISSKIPVKALGVDL